MQTDAISTLSVVAALLGGLALLIALLVASTALLSAADQNFDTWAENLAIEIGGKRYNLGQLLGKGYQRGQLPAP